MGLRPINAVVDITNLVSLGWGRPLHAYDADKVEGQMVLRNARGEAFDALDNKVYTLDQSMTVIADDKGPLCLGGIMGSTDIWTCIFISFFIGSLFSIAILSICGNIFQRFQYFMNYIGELFRKKERIPYRLPGMQQENFHFTIPILMSVMLYTGGVY